MELECLKLIQEPGLEDQIHHLGQTAWPEFLHHSNIHNWHTLFQTFPEYQVILRDSTQKVIAVGHTVPLVWDGTDTDLPPNINEILTRAIEANESSQPANTLSALAVIVASANRGKGHSTRILNAMKILALDQGLTALIAPVRPTMKATPK